MCEWKLWKRVRTRIKRLKEWGINPEQAFRYNKSELAMQSLRLWWWENRLKLLVIVALIYDFLLLLKHFDETLEFINKWCSRTGKRHQLALMPHNRLRTTCSVCIAIIINLENSR